MPRSSGVVNEDGAKVDEEVTRADDEHGVEDCEGRKSSTICLPLSRGGWMDASSNCP